MCQILRLSVDLCAPAHVFTRHCEDCSTVLARGGTDVGCSERTCTFNRFPGVLAFAYSFSLHSHLHLSKQKWPLSMPPLHFSFQMQPKPKPDVRFLPYCFNIYSDILSFCCRPLHHPGSPPRSQLLPTTLPPLGRASGGRQTAAWIIGSWVQRS